MMDTHIGIFGFWLTIAGWDLKIINCKLDGFTNADYCPMPGMW